MARRRDEGRTGNTKTERGRKVSPRENEEDKDSPLWTLLSDYRCIMDITNKTSLPSVCPGPSRISHYINNRSSGSGLFHNFTLDIESPRITWILLGKLVSVFCDSFAFDKCILQFMRNPISNNNDIRIETMAQIRDSHLYPSTIPLFLKEDCYVKTQPPSINLFRLNF